MKSLVTISSVIIFFVWGPMLRAQTQEEVDIRERIDFLFDAMRANDSTGLNSIIRTEGTLSSIVKDQSGKVVKRSSPLSGLAAAIGTPREDKWDERLWTYDIQIDGPMAYAWTEYTFYRNGQLSHCGVNVFEMMQSESGWQIAGVTDTRRNQDCRTYAVYDIQQMIDEWHHAAAVADEDTFFGSMTADGIYIGTDATERWTRDDMFALLGQYFQRETAWAFTPVERHVMLSEDQSMAWFDELLDTWMGTCRSSGVVKMEKGEWKIAHYHLSIAVPNDKVDGYLELIGKEKRN